METDRDITNKMEKLIEKGKDLTLINLYGSIERAREFDRNSLGQLEGLEKGESLVIFGFPNIEGLREVTSKINEDIEYYNPYHRYSQTINKKFNIYN